MGSFCRKPPQFMAIHQPPRILPGMAAYKLLVSVKFSIWKSLSFSLFLHELLFLGRVGKWQRMLTLEALLVTVPRISLNEMQMSRWPLGTIHSWPWWWCGHMEALGALFPILCLLSFSLHPYLFLEQLILASICSPSRDPISIGERTPLINLAHLCRSSAVID